MAGEWEKQTMTKRLTDERLAELDELWNEAMYGTVAANERLLHEVRDGEVLPDLLAEVRHLRDWQARAGDKLAEAKALIDVTVHPLAANPFARDVAALLAEVEAEGNDE